MEISAPASRANFGGTADRRETNRFPVQEDVRYRVLHGRGLPSRGVGRHWTSAARNPVHHPGKAPAGTRGRGRGELAGAVGWRLPTAICSGRQVVVRKPPKRLCRLARYEFKTRAVTEWPLPPRTSFLRTHHSPPAGCWPRHTASWACGGFVGEAAGNGEGFGHTLMAPRVGARVGSRAPREGSPAPTAD